jgi:hypothetical protein
MKLMLMANVTIAMPSAPCRLPSLAQHVHNVHRVVCSEKDVYSGEPQQEYLSRKVV